MEQFGNIDIYLFDQLLRGNIAPGMRVLDAGCGGGRNLVYLLREGYEVAFEPVNHRHRETGVSKYNNWGRLKASFSDLLGVMWLNTRARTPQGVDEV